MFENISPAGSLDFHGLARRKYTERIGRVYRDHVRAVCPAANIGVQVPLARLCWFEPELRMPGYVVLFQDKVSCPPILEPVSAGGVRRLPMTVIDPLVSRLLTQLKPFGRLGKLMEANVPE